MKNRFEIISDKIAGSLVGGAAGDALGYPVEFSSAPYIKKKFGERGITRYETEGGKALISDDTQMTLFTANGILFGETRNLTPGVHEAPHVSGRRSSLDWYATQTKSFESGRKKVDGISWLLEVSELYARRAPGTTCLSALNGFDVFNEDFIANPINDSKGCGGIMRVAPLGLHCSDTDIEALDFEGASLAAITHGHSLGYMPAAVLTHILNRIVYPENEALSLREIIVEAEETACRIFKGDCHLSELRAVIDKALALSENDRPDLENIEAIGAGWVAEETLGISLYCALRYEHDFSAGIIAAVNHGGDSDSTGAVTGNILGAIHGFSGIEEKWTENLELLDVLLEISDDLARIHGLGGYSDYDELWENKYVHRKRENGHA